jgi:hypothetical protein
MKITTHLNFCYEDANLNVAVKVTQFTERGGDAPDLNVVTVTHGENHYRLTPDTLENALDYARCMMRDMLLDAKDTNLTAIQMLGAN